MSSNLNQAILPDIDETSEQTALNRINKVSQIKYISYLILGSVSLVLGLIGLILPILPTTPFILLAGYSYMRSSSKFFVWVRYHPRFENIFEKKGLTKRGKITILTWAWIFLLAGAILTDLFWIKILLLSIGCIKTIVFIKIIRTIDNE